MRVLVAGGGTAGHVFPALALAERLREEGHGVTFVGTASGPEARLAPAAGFPFHAVRAEPFRREASLRAARAPLVAAAEVGACRPLAAGAEVVVGMGGYVSVPVVLAALAARVPVVLHEQNAVAGLANRAFARWARRVGLGFAEAARSLPRRARAVVTGNPVRSAILAVPARRAELAAEARQALGLAGGRRTVLVTGGSQGALRIDRAAAGAVRILRHRADLQLLVLTGPAHAGQLDRAGEEAGALAVRAVPFLERMELAYAAADLVVSRAGASTVAEVAVCGLPAILVPYPHATANHQEANARALARAGGAVVLPDAELGPEALAARVVELVDAPHRMETMGARAAAWGRPDAGHALAALVVEGASR